MDEALYEHKFNENLKSLKLNLREVFLGLMHSDNFLYSSCWVPYTVYDLHVAVSRFGRTKKKQFQEK